jgi:hypothetical protein
LRIFEKKAAIRPIGKLAGGERLFAFIPGIAGPAGRTAFSQCPGEQVCDFDALRGIDHAMNGIVEIARAPGGKCSHVAGMDRGPSANAPMAQSIDLLTVHVSSQGLGRLVCFLICGRRFDLESLE